MGVQYSCPNLLLVLSFMAFSGWLDSLVHICGNNVGMAPTKGVLSLFLVRFARNYLTRHHPTGISGSATADTLILQVHG